MINFSKRYSLSNVDNSYQITASAENTERKAVITKFANENTYSVAYFKENDPISKASYVEKGIKTLRMAKCLCEMHLQD